MCRKLHKRLEIDECLECHGTWLDQTELGALVGSWNDLPNTGKVVKIAGAVASCPRCKCGLEHRTYSSKCQTMVDRCPSCSGIWLDKGELDLILREIYG